jgi:hypothetical protein
MATSARVYIRAVGTRVKVADAALGSSVAAAGGASTTGAEAADMPCSERLIITTQQKKVRN